MKNISHRANEIPLKFISIYPIEFLHLQKTVEFFKLTNIVTEFGEDVFNSLNMTIEDFKLVFNRHHKMYKSGKFSVIEYREQTAATSFHLLRAIGEMDTANDNKKILDACMKLLKDSFKKLDANINPQDPSTKERIKLPHALTKNILNYDLETLDETIKGLKHTDTTNSKHTIAEIQEKNITQTGLCLSQREQKTIQALCKILTDNNYTAGADGHIVFPTNEYLKAYGETAGYKRQDALKSLSDLSEKRFVIITQRGNITERECRSLYEMKEIYENIENAELSEIACGGGLINGKLKYISVKLHNIYAVGENNNRFVLILADIENRLDQLARTKGKSKAGVDKYIRLFYYHIASTQFTARGTLSFKINYLRLAEIIRMDRLLLKKEHAQIKKTIIGYCEDFKLMGIMKEYKFSENGIIDYTLNKEYFPNSKPIKATAKALKSGE